MYIHPSIHLEIARQLQQDVLARAERRRQANAVRAARRPPTLREPSPATTGRLPHRVSA